MWFFSGYQRLRDSDSQPGTDPGLPRKYEQDKILAKLTWRLAASWQLVQSFHDEFWSNPRDAVGDEAARCDAAPRRVGASDQLRSSDAHGLSQYRLGRARGTVPLHAGHVADLGHPTIANRIDLPKPLERRPSANRQGAAAPHDGQDDPQPLSGRVVSAPITSGEWARRSTGRASRGRRPADRCELRLHERRLVADARCRSRPIQEAGSSRPPLFVSDALRLGSRVTINPGLRFDHSRAISQDVPEFDAFVQETGRIIEGRGTLDTWNIVSPRVGVVIKLDAAGRTMLRANAGRFSQGMLTGEISAVHPGRTRNTIIQEPSGMRSSCAIPVRSQLDPEVRPPSHGSVLHRPGSRGRRTARGVRRLRPQGRPGLHRVGGSRR